MIRVYTASKISTAQFWRDIHAKHPSVYFHARWIKHNAIGTPDLPGYAAKFWQENEEDIRCADALIIYGLDDEHLRGALVEAGIAIAADIPVYTVGDHKDYGTWQFHPGVTRAINIEQALQLLEDLDKKLGLHHK